MGHSTITVLSGKDASWLMSKRSFLPHETYLSVKGCITSMSEKMRVKNDDFFLIELDYCVYIIVKDFHLYWHSQLVPQDTVVFYELRLTTIEKGVSTPQPILSAWRPSRILKAPHDKNIVVLTLEEWLSRMRLKERFYQIPEDVNDGNREIEGNALSFSGKVTSNDKASDGIYELNNDIRLVTWSNPSILGDSCLHIGCHVEVYNAHEVENPESAEDKILMCCTRTLLIRSEVDTVTRMNLVAAMEWAGKQNSSCSLDDLKLTISRYRLNFKEIEHILHLRDRLKTKKRKEMVYILHNITKSFCRGNIQDERISVLDMFLRHSDFCPFVSAKASNCRIKRQMTVACLKEDNTTCNDDEESGRDTNSPTWSYKRREWKDREMLLGRILVNDKGQTEFEDHSGKIPVVLVHGCNEGTFHRNPSNPEQSSISLSKELGKQKSFNSHVCSCQCQKELKPADKISCPILTSWIIGKVLYVTEFQIITENCCDNRGGCETMPYLIFSLQDCVILETVSCNPPTNIYTEPALWTRNSNEYPRYHDYVVTDFSHQVCYLYVSEKQQVCSSEHGNCFQLQGRILDPFLFISNDSFIQSETKTEHMKNLEGVIDEKSKSKATNYSVLKRKHENVPFVSDKCGTKETKDSDLESGLEGTSSCFKTLQESLSRTVPISMHFKQGNACLFPLIHPGHCYQLMANETASAAFQPMFTNEKLGRVVNKCGAKTCIKAPEELKVNEIHRVDSAVGNVRTAIDVEDKLAPVSLLQVSSEEFQDTLVSFTAMILRREVQRSYFASSKDQKVSFGLSDVRLDLCNVDSSLSGQGKGFDDTISLYFNSSQMVYVFGLIPGSVIDFCCVERKVSKNNVVYCRFIAVSSLHVKYFIPQRNGLENVSSSNALNFTQFPREHIAAIWDRDPGAFSYSNPATWHIQCHICVVFSIKVELLCKKCGSLYVNNECIDRGCGNTSFDVAVNSAVLVEDGTCQAIVKVRKSHLMCKLLTLNDEQWNDVTSLLHDTGRVYVSNSKHGNDSSPSDPLGIFLSGLIVSSLVVRPVKMLVRVFKDSVSRKTVNEMEEKEFKLKDFSLGRVSQKTLDLPYLSLDCMDLEEESL